MNTKASKKASMKKRFTLHHNPEFSMDHGCILEDSNYRNLI